MLSTCGGGTGESPTVTNRAPSFDAESYVFTVPEDDGVVAGAVEAVDPDRDNRVFCLSGPDTGVFPLCIPPQTFFLQAVSLAGPRVHKGG